MKKMIDNYDIPYIRAVAVPWPEMEDTFGSEIEILLQNCRGKTVLDVGCGIGRPAHLLADHVKDMVLMDNNANLLKMAKERLGSFKNLEFKFRDVFGTNYDEDSFDVVFATYNFIGCIQNIPSFLKEMKRVLRPNGKLILFYWKDTNKNTEFLKKYYPSIGISINQIQNEFTNTSHGISARPSIEKIRLWTTQAGFKHVKSSSCGPCWNYTIARKGMK